LQLFDRQLTEDGDLSTKAWTPDLSPPREGEEDPDTDDYLPIPRAKPVRKGKQSNIHHISDEEDEDCCLLEPIDAIPISWKPPPCVPAKQDAEGSSRKRTDAPGSDSPKAKRIKKSGSKLNRAKPMPTTKG
jgi:hypothetical protein